jgi:hypothetical protein
MFREATHFKGPLLATEGAFQDATHQGSRVLRSICADAPIEVLAAMRDCRCFVLKRQDWPIVATAALTTTPGGCFITAGQSTGGDTGSTAVSSDGMDCDMTTDTGDNDEMVACTHPIFRPYTGHDAAFYAKIKIADVSASHVFAGLANMGPITAAKTPFAAAADGTVLATIDGIYFLRAAAAAAATITISARQDADVDAATITMDSNFADGDIVELAFRVIGDEAVMYWANNLSNAGEPPESGTLIYSNVAPQTNDYEPMSWCIAHQNGGAAADTVSIQESWCWSETSS